MIPLLLLLLAVAAVYLGTIEAAFSALMRLSLRLIAERSDRPGALGAYLDDPLLLFVPVRFLLALVTAIGDGAVRAGDRARRRPIGRAGRAQRDRLRDRLRARAAGRHRRPRSRAGPRVAAAVVRADPEGIRAAGAIDGPLGGGVEARAGAAVDAGRSGDGSQRGRQGLHRERRAGRHHRRRGTAPAAEHRRFRRHPGARSHDAASRHRRDQGGGDRSATCASCFASRSTRGFRSTRTASTTSPASSSSRTWSCWIPATTGGRSCR